jgi:serine/threonine protein kinase/O-acetyl-ADP-ribose deacetylase (regulator of RNase III)
MNAGDYVTPAVRLIGELRSGGMGTVWLAEHQALDTRVAVKLMKPEHEANAEMVERFRREARVTARIRSPHVVQMLDFGNTAGGTPFLVMELLDGETLRDRIRRLGSLPFREVIHVVVQTANALGAAHALGVVHRDVKPDNIFLIDVGGEPFVKVLDFGLVKPPKGTFPPLTDPRQSMGTFAYMSPEQSVSAGDVDHRADVWALSVVAYEALTGRMPFPGETPIAQVLAMHNGGMTLPSTIRPGLPAEVDAWAGRAFQKDLEQRFGSVYELAHALAAAMTAASVTTGSAAGAPPPDLQTPPVHVSSSETTRPRYVPVVSAARVPVPPLIGPFIEPVIHMDARTLISGPETPREVAIGAGEIRLLLGSILESGAEAIVHATDPSLSGTGEIDVELHAAAGPELEAELRALGFCPEGGAVITGAGRLAPATRFVIHAVPPAYAPERSDGAELLRSAHHESLRLAEEHGIREVAFPAIGAHAPGYPVGAAAPIAVRAAVDHLAAHARSVRSILFVLDTSADLTVYARVLAEIDPAVAARPRVESTPPKAEP